MARKSTPTTQKSAAPKTRKLTEIASTTPVRNTPIPKGIEATQPKTPTGQDAIAVRAYLIWETGGEGNALDHWTQAERELRGE